MSLKLTCPECDAKVAVPDEGIGRMVRCKQCSSKFKASEPKSAGTKKLAASAKKSTAKTAGKDKVRRRPADDEPDEEDNEKDDLPKCTPRSRMDRRSNRKKPPIVLISVVTVIIALGAIGGIAYHKDTVSSEANKPDIAKIGPLVKPGEEFTEEVRIESLGHVDNGDGTKGFAFHYKWIGGKVLPGEYVILITWPNGETRELDFETEGKAVGTRWWGKNFDYEFKEFVLWIAKRRRLPNGLEDGPLARVSFRLRYNLN